MKPSKLELKLTEKLGTATRTKIVFKSVDLVIVEAGETITAQHLSMVQKLSKTTWI